MKKIILCLLLLAVTAPCFADVLLPPEEQAKVDAARAKQKAEYERKRARCPKNKPLYFDGQCYSCDDPKEFDLDNVAGCKNLCPNRDVFVVNPSMGGHSPRRCVQEKRYIQLMEEQEKDQKATERKRYIQSKLQAERDEAAKKCGCPLSHPLYGRKKDKSGKTIELCHSCRTPEKLPEVDGWRVCRAVRFIEEGDGEVARFTALRESVTPDTTTVPCQSKDSSSGDPQDPGAWRRL